MHTFQIHSNQIIPVVFLILDLLFLLVLLHLFLVLRKKRILVQKKENGVAQYDQAVCQGMAEAHVLLERDVNRPVYFTDNFEELTGLPVAQMEADFHLPESLMPSQMHKEFVQAYYAWTREKNLEYDFRVAQKKEQWIRLIVAPAGETHDFFIFRDVTHEKKLQQGLRQQLEAAQEESQSKTSFLSRMSHEIRTPINGIIGMLALSHKQVEPGSVVDNYLEKAENLSAHLISLVNDILDMSRIEAGRIELENKPFDIRNFAAKIRNMFQETVQEKGLQFEVELLDFDRYYLIGDEFRLSQVIVNFLSNAVKFTSEGEIRVTCRQMMREKDTVDLMIRVHDTGIGMNPEFVNRIFRPFEQENAEISKKYGGTGLGMAISDQIIRLMGGEIVVDSMPNRGSDFIVYLHLPSTDTLEQAPTEEETSYVDDYTYKGKRILLAEDNEINAEIAVEILKEFGAEVEVAENGQRAVEMFAEHPQEYYDFILMDIQMPVLNGRDAARQIRQMNRDDAKDILIFALSADAFLEDERKSVEAGMNGHFAKPVDYEYVRKQIGMAVKRRQR